ncbi:MAG: YdcF family protein [Chitinophagales bacterium]|nr:YdcF family protein [Chitinophagales bacterium]
MTIKKLLSNKYTYIFIVLFSVFILWLIIFSSNLVEKASQNKLYNDVNKIPHNRVGLLLGTCKTLEDKVTINPFWQKRVDATYILWKNKKIDRILISGDNGWYGYNEPHDFRDTLIAMGIPDSVIYCDYAGFRTFDSMVRCKKVFQENKVTVISQAFHNKRAIFIADANDMNVIGFNAKDVALNESVFNFFREKLARVKMVLDIYVLKTEPHFLGETIDIK